MAPTGAMIREMTQAVLVLALVLFNFAHLPASERTAYDAALTAYLLPASAIVLDCGESRRDADHPPCHACRIGSGADLARSPFAMAVLRVACLPNYPALGQSAVPFRHRLTASPRAPPIA